MLLTGDIANSGDPREHERARELLAPLACPSTSWPATTTCFAERQRYAVARRRRCAWSPATRRSTAATTATLDVDWLAQRLDEDRETPTIVAMHHPPILVGLPWLDEIGLPESDRTALAALLARSPQVKRVVAGHVHRTVTATLGGCAVVTCASTNIQSDAGLRRRRAWRSSASRPRSSSTPCCGDDVVTHVQPI